MSPIEQLVREEGEAVAGRVAATLGIPREVAERALPEAAAVVMARFAPRGTSVDPAENSLDGVLGDTGEQLGERLGSRLGIPPEKAAALVPLLLPLILRFLVKRLPYGGPAFALLANTVKAQGYGSLDELALRLVDRYLPRPGPEPGGMPRPSLATRLGRLAGKYFPSEEN